MTREQALHKAIQNDGELNFLRSGLKCYLETKQFKYVITNNGAIPRTDPRVTDYERLIQQRIDVLTRYYLP